MLIYGVDAIRLTDRQHDVRFFLPFFPFLSLFLSFFAVFALPIVSLPLPAGCPGRRDVHAGILITRPPYRPRRSSNPARLVSCYPARPRFEITPFAGSFFFRFFLLRRRFFETVLEPRRFSNATIGRDN